MNGKYNVVLLKRIADFFRPWLFDVSVNVYTFIGCLSVDTVAGQAPVLVTH